MAAKQSDPGGNTADREIIITRVFDAPRELVWEAWTDPRQVVQWWGPKGFTTTIEQMEVKPGGTWKHIMHGPDGTDYPNKSVFKEVVKPERITYSHGGGRKGAPGATFEATWTFEVVEENKTRLTIHMIFPTAEGRDTVVREYGAIEGGKQTLGRLAEKLAKTPVIVERTFNAPVATVWKALTHTEDIQHWFFEIKELKPEVGFTFEFLAGKGDVKYCHQCRVMEVIPEKKLAYTWRYEGQPGDSLVTIELFAEGDKTRLRLTHEGLETFLPETNSRLERGNFLNGWTHIIGTSLANYLEKT